VLILLVKPVEKAARLLGQLSMRTLFGVLIADFDGLPAFGRRCL
jgi:hypothetical protein